jgi:serine/threonine-protein kinase
VDQVFNEAVPAPDSFRLSFEPSASGTRQLQIGKYLVLARVATGGMGAVYKARDVELGREVALKVLSPECAAKPILLERFRLEALYGAKLRHKNVVHLFESGEFSGIHYLALEFVEGIDLQKYVEQQGQLDVEESRRIMIQAAKAIGHLHEQGVVHRDIKPSNFLISHRKGRPFLKLIDLGLARHRQEETDGRVTVAGSTLGTVDYIAPEQARDSGSADVRSDIYALGCTWYHLLAGRPPFAEGSVAEKVYRHMEVEPPDIRLRNPHVTERIAAILGRMLAKDPAERYQAPAALIWDLQTEDKVEEPFSPDVLAGLAQGASPAASPQPIRPRRRRGSASTRKRRRRRSKKGRPPMFLIAFYFFLFTLVAVGGFALWLILKPLFGLSD